MYGGPTALPPPIHTYQATSRALGTDGSCSTFDLESAALPDDRLLHGADAEPIHITRNVVKRYPFAYWRPSPQPSPRGERGAVSPKQRRRDAFATRLPAGIAVKSTTHSAGAAKRVTCPAPGSSRSKALGALFPSPCRGSREGTQHADNTDKPPFVGTPARLCALRPALGDPCASPSRPVRQPCRGTRSAAH
jgi:hypothetical protein